MIGGSSGVVLEPLGNNTFTPGYIGMFQSLFNSNIAVVSTPVAYNGSISHFHVAISAAPGTGNSWTFHVFVNGGNLNYSCAITGAATSCTDAATSPALTEGNLVAVEVTYNGTQAPHAPGMFASWSARYG
jgi:hypothetical protein